MTPQSIAPRRLSLAVRAFALLSACCVSGVALGQESPVGAASDSREIRQSAERILSSPEFRHFKRLERGGSSFGSGSGNSPSDSGGPRTPGSGGTGADEGGGPRDRDGAADNSSQKSPASDSMSSPSTMSTVGVPAAVGTLLTVLSWLMLIAVAAVIVFLIVMAVRNYEGGAGAKEIVAKEELQGEIEPERPPGELPADIYVAEARKLAAAGSYREAIAQLLLGAMSYVERAGLIHYHRGLTQRDYLRMLRGQKQKYAAMKTMVGIYEPLGFGRRDPQKSHFDASLSQYETAFQTVPGDSVRSTVRPS